MGECKEYFQNQDENNFYGDFFHTSYFEPSQIYLMGRLFKILYSIFHGRRNRLPPPLSVVRQSALKISVNTYLSLTGESGREGRIVQVWVERDRWCDVEISSITVTKHGTNLYPRIKISLKHQSETLNRQRHLELIFLL